MQSNNKREGTTEELDTCTQSDKYLPGIRGGEGSRQRKESSKGAEACDLEHI